MSQFPWWRDFSKHRACGNSTAENHERDVHLMCPGGIRDSRFLVYGAVEDYCIHWRTTALVTSLRKSEEVARAVVDAAHVHISYRGVI